MNPEDKVGLFADMTVFTSYAMQVVSAFMMLVMIFIILPRAIVSARRINEVLSTNPKILNGTVTETAESDKGTIEFKNVSFKYPDASDYVTQRYKFQG